MWHQKERFEQLGVKVLVLTFERPRIEVNPHYPYYYDSDRRLYKYFGMFRAGFWDLWGPRTLLAYLHLLLRGRKMVPSTSDIHQRGGNVLLDPHGRVKFHHVSSGPADRPDLEIIFRLIEKGS